MDNDKIVTKFIQNSDYVLDGKEVRVFYDSSDGFLEVTLHEDNSMVTEFYIGQKRTKLTSEQIGKIYDHCNDLLKEEELEDNWFNRYYSEEDY
jgi:hypothetical protein